MVELYCLLLDFPDEKIDGKIFNAGYQNHTLMELAEMVKKVVNNNLSIKVEPTDDMRSYHVSSEKIQKELGYGPNHSIEDAISDLVAAFHTGKLPNSMDDPRYYNIKMMQKSKLT